ncbi:MAG: hypothetical protein RIB65_10190 [Ilumatobacter fluminis]|uniref:hypothetical protein n=1 Tax=Ilumatobacter fluminis TaxID=467091 RepID=UPI0032EB5435
MSSTRPADGTASSDPEPADPSTPDRSSAGWDVAVDGGDRWGSVPGGVATAIGAVTGLVVVLVGVVGAFSVESTLLGDRALLAMRTRDVFSSSIPVVGAYSRFGWSHPGPWSFYLQAVPFRVLGGDGTALAVAAATVNAAVLGLGGWVAARRSAAVTAVFTVATAVLIVNGTLVIHEAWNPAMAIAPMLVAVVGAAVAWTGDGAALAVVVGCGALAAQTHVGVALPVAVAVVIAGVGWFRHRPDDGGVPVAALVVAGLAVAPIAFDTVTDWPGNAWRLVESAFSDDLERVGAVDALRLILRSASPEFVVDPGYEQFFGFVVSGQSVGWLPGAVLVLVALVARYGASASLRRLALIQLAVSLGAFVGIAGIRGPLHAYLLGVLPVLAAIGWSIVAAEVAARLVSAPPAWMLAVSLLALPLVAWVAADGPWVDQAADGDVDAVEAVATDIERWADGRSNPTVALEVSAPDDFQGVDLFGGLVEALDRRGVEVVPGAGHEFLLPDRAGDAVSATVTVVLLAPSDPTGDVDGALVVYDPLTAAERTRLTELLGQLVTVLEQNDLAVLVPAVTNGDVDAVPVDRFEDPDTVRRQLAELGALLERGPRLVVTVS